MRIRRLSSAVAALATALAYAFAYGDEPRAAALDCVITPSAEIEVSSAVPGLLQEVLVERSARVEAGQLLARLESEVEQASAELAHGWAAIETEIRLEEVALGREGRRLDRVTELYRQRAVALDDKDDQEAQAEVLRLRVRQARERRWLRELELAKAQAALERRLVRSPVSGVVAARHRSAGEYVENQPILRLARLDPLHVETIVPMARFGAIRVGMQAEIVPEAVDSTPRLATVTVVDAVGDAASGTFGVRLALANADNRLPAGQKCALRFVSLDTAQRESEPERAVEPELRASQAPAAVPQGEPAPADRPSTPLRGIEPPRDWHAPAPRRVDPGPRTVANDDPARLSGAGASCWTSGPLGSRAAAVAASERLEATGLRVSVREEPGPVRGHVVASTPSAGNESMSDEVARLKRAGVRDLLAMGSGSGRLAGRIALGAYRNEGSAQVRREQLAGLGFDTEILPIYGPSTQWWLDTESPTGHGPMIPRGPLAELPTRPASCPGVLAGG